MNDDIQIEETSEYQLLEALNELHASITPYTTLGEILFSNIHLLAEYFKLHTNLGDALYEELKWQLGYSSISQDITS